MVNKKDDMEYAQKIASEVFNKTHSCCVYTSKKISLPGLLYVIEADSKGNVDDKIRSMYIVHDGVQSEPYPGVSYPLVLAYLKSVVDTKKNDALSDDDQFYRPQPNRDGFNIMRIQNKDLGMKVEEFLKEGRGMFILENDPKSDLEYKSYENWKVKVEDILTKYGSI